MDNVKEIIGSEHDGIVTMMFVDTILEGGKDLYHRAFWAGDERRECIDEENNIYLVAIDQPKEGAEELYNMINTTVYMLREHFGYDFSRYQEFWMEDEETFARKSTYDEWNVRSRLLWDEE